MCCVPGVTLTRSRFAYNLHLKDPHRQLDCPLSHRTCQGTFSKKTPPLQNIFLFLLGFLTFFSQWTFMTSVANGALRYQLQDLLWFHSCLITSSCLLLASIPCAGLCVHPQGSGPRAQESPLGHTPNGRVSHWLQSLPSLLKCSLPTPDFVRPGLCLSR